MGKIYDANAEDWKMFEAAYKGGSAWKAQGFLYQYQNETSLQLQTRTKQTPLENHCESVVATYSGFIWRDPPKRNLGKLNNNVSLNRLLKDADKEGTGLNEFMKVVQMWGSVFGVLWIIVDKPNVKATTHADEITGGIRPYLRFYKPLDVLDFEFTQKPSGGYELTWFKVKEETTSREGDIIIEREWTTTNIVTKTTIGETTTTTDVPNPLGRIPAFPHYNKKSISRGLAASDLQDILGMQISIYNDLSELTQMIRGSNHKTLVKNRNDEASTGAGGVILMGEDTESAKKPYLLAADAEALSGLLAAIDKKTEMINRMAHLTPVRTYRTQVISAVAMETEFQILNTLLAEKAAQLQLTEYAIFECFCAWEGIDAEKSGYEVTYPSHFELRDKRADLDFIKAAREAAALINSSTLQLELNKQFVRVALPDDDLIEKIEGELGKAKAAVQPAAKTIQMPPPESDRLTVIKSEKL